MTRGRSGEAAHLLDEKRMISKEFKFASHDTDYPARATPPSQTQLWLMRATARALYDERAPYTKSSLMNEADLSKEVRRSPSPPPPTHSTTITPRPMMTHVACVMTRGRLCER